MRRATPDDIPRLVADAEAFFAPSSIPGGFDAAHFGTWLAGWIGDPAFWCAITDTGSVAVVFHTFFGNGGLYGQEHWIYDGAGNGLALIEAMEAEARKRGAVALGVSTQIEQRGEALARLYERRGYSRREIALAKEF